MKEYPKTDYEKLVDIKDNIKKDLKEDRTWAWFFGGAMLGLFLGSLATYLYYV